MQGMDIIPRCNVVPNNMKINTFRSKYYTWSPSSGLRSLIQGLLIIPWDILPNCIKINKQVVFRSEYYIWILSIGLRVPFSWRETTTTPAIDNISFCAHKSTIMISEMIQTMEAEHITKCQRQKLCIWPPLFNKWIYDTGKVNGLLVGNGN